MRTSAVVMIGLVMLAVAGCASSASQATAPPTVDVTGKWSGTWAATNASLGSGSIQMTLKQSGSQYTGNLLITGTLTDPSGYTQGVVSGNELRILQPTSVTGRLTVQGDTMSGELQGMVAARVTLQRQK